MRRSRVAGDRVHAKRSPTADIWRNGSTNMTLLCKYTANHVLGIERW